MLIAPVNRRQLWLSITKTETISAPVLLIVLYARGSYQQTASVSQNMMTQVLTIKRKDAMPELNAMHELVECLTIRWQKDNNITLLF